VAAAFRASVAAHPERPLALKRGADGQWQGVTDGAARAAADVLAQAFLDVGLS
jgi:hypothetical protein